MRIECSRPPNWEAVIAAFPHVQSTHGVLFCYGDTIHNPDGIVVSKATHAHEEVHSIRQAKTPGGVEAWWDRYLVDPLFRFTEESPAHIVEYRILYDDNAERRIRRFYLTQIAERLAGPLYGRLISKEKATRLLKDGVRYLQAQTTGEKEAA